MSVRLEALLRKVRIEVISAGSLLAVPARPKVELELGPQRHRGFAKLNKGLHSPSRFPLMKASDPLTRYLGSNKTTAGDKCDLGEVSEVTQGKEGVELNKWFAFGVTLPLQH